jgi:CHAT domain
LPIATASEKYSGYESEMARHPRRRACFRYIANSRSIGPASNCFLIAATCVGERVGASVMLSGYSDATIKLITGLFRELETDASTGRAEGLRRSMLALIDRGGDNSHPANWAPFVVVGEGAR